MFSAQYGFSKLMPRIFNYGDIPNINLTPDKELNILIYRLPSYLIIYRSHILLKMVWFFLAHPVHDRIEYSRKYLIYFCTLLTHHRNYSKDCHPHEKH